MSSDRYLCASVSLWLIFIFAMRGMQERLKKQERYRWLLTLGGVVATVGYWALILNWSGRHDWHLSKLSAQDAGTFLSGAFAPVAFLWLVIGFYLQSAELKQNSESLALQAAEMKNAVQQAALQTSALNENKNFVRQDVLNNTKNMYENDLATLSANVFLGLFETNFGRVDSWWERVSGGDREIFARSFLREIRHSPSVQSSVMYDDREGAEERAIIELSYNNYQFWRYVYNYTHRYRKMVETFLVLCEFELAESYENRDFGLMNKLLLGAEEVRKSHDG